MEDPRTQTSPCRLGHPSSEVTMSIFRKIAAQRSCKLHQDSSNWAKSLNIFPDLPHLGSITVTTVADARRDLLFTV